MPSLEITLKIPIESEPLIGAAGFTFTHWMPLGKQEGIEIVDDNFKTVPWFDIKLVVQPNAKWQWGVRSHSTESLHSWFFIVLTLAANRRPS